MTMASIIGARGYYRANLRHGVSTVHSGERYTPWELFFTMQNNHTDQIKLDATTATGRVDERSGIDLIEDVSFMPRLSKHSDLFSAAAKHIDIDSVRRCGGPIQWQLNMTLS
jgi:hypothetical protein